MHELGLLYETAKTVTAFAEKNDISRVEIVEMDVGELSGVLPNVFDDYYQYVAEQYPVLKDSKLKLHMIPGEASCNDCKSVYNVMENQGRCPKCKSQNKTILGGQQIIIRQLEY
jgi:hydrogenase nickel incorporation protein HypA/HybF